MPCPLDGADALSPESGLQIRLLVCSGARGMGHGTWGLDPGNGLPGLQVPRFLTNFFRGCEGLPLPWKHLSILDLLMLLPGGRGGGRGALTIELRGILFGFGQPVFEPWLHRMLAM